MKITGHVLTAADHGDKLTITAQAQKVGAAEWRPWLSIAIDVPMTDANRKAFYVGRPIRLTVKPT